MNAICALAEVEQQPISKSHDRKNGKLNAEANEHVLTKCKKCVEDADGRLKTNADWVQPTKHIPITCLYKNNKENMKHENVNNNRHNVFIDDTEIDVEQKEDTEKC